MPLLYSHVMWTNSTSLQQLDSIILWCHCPSLWGLALPLLANSVCSRDRTPWSVPTHQAHMGPLNTWHIKGHTPRCRTPRVEKVHVLKFSAGHFTPLTEGSLGDSAGLLRWMSWRPGLLPHQVDGLRRALRWVTYSPCAEDSGKWQNQKGRGRGESPSSSQGSNMYSGVYTSLSLFVSLFLSFG